MTDLPGHVLADASPAPTPRRSRTSPHQPYDSKHYPLPKWEWVFLYGPPVAFSGLFVWAATDPHGAKDLIFLPLIINLTLIVPMLWRLPQELTRSRARYWRKNLDQNAWEWHDPSGEWSRARLQQAGLILAMRYTVALAMPFAWVCAFVAGGHWPFALTPVIGALVYLHRHLPTMSRHARAQRQCDACGLVRPASAVRICPRCGRVAKIEAYPSLPALRRRWRDL